MLNKPVEDRIQNRIVAFDILHEQWVSESKRTLQVFPERIIQERSLRYLFVCVLPENVLCSLARRVDDQRVTVESLEYRLTINRDLIKSDEYTTFLMG